MSLSESWMIKSLILVMIILLPYEYVYTPLNDELKISEKSLLESKRGYFSLFDSLIPNIELAQTIAKKSNSKFSHSTKSITATGVNKAASLIFTLEKYGFYINKITWKNKVAKIYLNF